MRGCLFTLALGAVAIALIIVIGLPKVAAGLLTSAVTAAGLQADDTTVTVSSDPPTDLLGLRADHVSLRATDATFRGLRIGAVDLRLGDVSLLDRTADTVSGTLSHVTVPDVGGSTVVLDAITLGGGGDTITATTTIDGATAESLIADAVSERAGIRPTSVTISAPDRLTVDVGTKVGGRLRVSATGDLVVQVDANPLGIDQVVLLRGGQDLPIRLTTVRVKNGDLVLGGDLSIGILG